jgi:multimeric flavodoxin WrbA
MQKEMLMKRVLVVSSSLRTGSNSEQLAKAAAKGAEEAGNSVEFLSLKDKNLQFCRGCLACQKTGKCVIRDDMDSMIEKVKDADAIIFATPIYYYEMSGQLKTFLDRCNPLYIADYQFRKIYFLSASAEDGDEVYQRALSGLQGWVDCFPKAELIRSVVSAGGINEPNGIRNHADLLNQAYALGRNA